MGIDPYEKVNNIFKMKLAFLVLVMILILYDSCRSDKAELITQFQENIPATPIEVEDFYGRAEMETWYLAGKGKVVGFLRQPGPTFQFGHYAVVADLNMNNQKIRLLTKEDMETHFHLAYANHPSYIGMSNTYSQPRFIRSLDGGDKWKQFYRGEGAQFYFTDFQFDKFQMFDEYSGIMAVNTFVGSEIYSFSESQATLSSKLEPYYVCDITFIDRFKGWLLCRTASRLLPSDFEDSYLLSTSDGGKTWADTLLIDSTWTYEKLIVLDEQNMVIQRGHTIRSSMDGGHTWLQGSNLNYNLAWGKDGTLYRLKKGKQYKIPHAFSNSYYFSLERSFDLGKTWSAFGKGDIFGQNPHIEFDEYGQALISFETGEVFVSKDSGNSWIQVKKTNVRP